MRVISGKYKGRKLEFPIDSKVRPTADMVKGALFSSLFDIEGYYFLDLFCGCGGIGVEALSRGAKEVHFVDNNPKSLAYVRKNVEKLENNYKIFKSDYLSFLKNAKISYDIIFMDPPYLKKEFYDNALMIIKQNNLLSNEGKIVLEHDENLKVDFVDFEVLSNKRYGKKYLTFLKQIKQ